MSTCYVALIKHAVLFFSKKLLLPYAFLYSSDAWLASHYMMLIMQKSATLFMIAKQEVLEASLVILWVWGQAPMF